MRLLVRDLSPGTNYTYQIRTTSTRGVSAWSQAFTFTTIKDEVAPNPPTGLTIAHNASNYVLNWTAPTINEDGSALSVTKDFRDYEITLVANSITKVIYSATTHRQLTPGDLQGLFGSYTNSITATVRSRDVNGNTSIGFATASLNKPVPNPPVITSWSSVGSSFVGIWTSPTTHVDGSALNDLTDFQISVTANSTTKTLYLFTNRFEFTLQDNIAAFGTAQGTVQLSVAARDRAGTTSALAQSSFSNPAPSTPTGLTGVGTYDGIALSWTISPDTDLKYYQVFYNSTPTGVGTLVYTGTANSFVYPSTLYGANHYFYVTAVDTFGTSSPASAWAGPYVPKNAFNVDTTAPSAPTNVTTTSGSDPNNIYGLGSYIDVSWTAVVASDLDVYKVRYSQSPTGPWDYIDVPAGTTTARINFLEPNKNYYVAVQARDFVANASAFTNSTSYPQLTAKDATVPTAPGTITLTGFSTSFQATWPENSETDVAGGAGYYAFDYSTSPTFASGVITRNVTSPIIGVNGLTTGNTYYARVRAVDASGNTSTNSATASVVLGSPASYTSDGVAPTNSPTPTVNPLYQALEIKWSPTTNPDPVTYEVHVSTTTGFTPSAGTKALEVDGTFAIVKTLPGTSTALTYGTTYYVKLITKDRDGSAPAGSQASAVTLKVDNGDIAANAVRATQIMAGQVTADKLTIGGTNLVDEPGFENGGLSWVLGNTTISSTYSRNGLTSARLAGNGTIQDPVTKAKIYVTPGDVYYYEGWIASDAGTNGTAQFGFFAYTKNGTLPASPYISTPISGSTTSASPGTFSKVSALYTVASDVAYIVPWYSVRADSTTGAFYFDDLLIRRQSATTDISDGAITTNKITVNTLLGDRIQANTLSGDRVTANSLDAGTLKAGTAFAQNLTVASTFTLGSSAGGPGSIKSFDYNGTTLGFQLNSNGLDIRNGTISAKALQIQNSQNLMPPQYAGFEFRTDFYNPGVGLEMGPGMTSSITTSSPKFENQALRVVVTSGTPLLYFAPTSNLTYNIPVEASTTYIFSWYANLISGTATMKPIMRRNSSANNDDTSATTRTITNGWTRYSQVFTTDATQTAVGFYFNFGGTGTTDIDGIQFEVQDGNLTTPSQWKPPGITRIDGATIRTGSIQSTSLVTYDGTSQPAWSILTTGAATLNDVLVRGQVIVGSALGSTNNNVAIQSYQTAGANRWSIKGDGTFTIAGGAGTGTTSNIRIDNTGFYAYDSSASSTPTVQILADGSAAFAGTITAMGGAFAGNVTIDANANLTMNGGKIRANTNNPTTSNNLVFDASGISGYDSSGVRQFYFGSDGTHTLTNTTVTNSNYTGLANFNAGNTSGGTANASIGFGYNGNPQYRHNIRIANDAATQAGNRMYFYMWDPTVDAPPTLGSKQVGWFDGTGVFNVNFQIKENGSRVYTAANPPPVVGVQSLAVINNAVVNGSTGNVVLTNSLTPLFTSVNTTGSITENGIRVLTNITVTNNASVSVSNGTAAITNSLTPTLTNATIPSLLGNTLGGTDGTYFAWDGGANARMGFSKKSGVVTKLGYANNTFAVTEYVGQTNIDPANTQTDRFTIAPGGAATFANTLTVTQGLTGLSTATFSAATDGLMLFSGGAADGTAFLYSTVSGTQKLRLERVGRIRATEISLRGGGDVLSGSVTFAVDVGGNTTVAGTLAGVAANFTGQIAAYHAGVATSGAYANPPAIALTGAYWNGTVSTDEPMYIHVFHQGGVPTAAGQFRMTFGPNSNPDNNLIHIAGDGSHAMGIGSSLITSSIGQLYVTPTANSRVGLVVRGHATQAVNLQEWQTTTPTTVGSISNTGLATFAGVKLTAGTLEDLSAAGMTAAASGTALGDKIALYGNGASGYGIGVQTNRLVNYIPSGNAVSIRPSSASGNASSGSDAITLFASGALTASGQGTFGTLSTGTATFTAGFSVATTSLHTGVATFVAIPLAQAGVSVTESTAQSQDNGYGIVGVTGAADATVKSYYSATRTGTVAYGWGIDSTNRMRLGQATGSRVLSSNSMSIDTGGNVLINGTLGVTGTTTLAGLTITGPLTVPDIRNAYNTSNTTGANVNQWVRIANTVISTAFSESVAEILLAEIGDGNIPPSYLKIFFRVKQQAAFGSDPYVSVIVLDRNGTPVLADVVAVINQNTPTTSVTLWMRLTGGFQSYAIFPRTATGSQGVTYYHLDGFTAALPAGTQVAAQYGTGSFKDNIVAQGTTARLDLLDTTAAQSTPNKYLRSLTGEFQIVNSALATPILRLTDAGALSTTTSITAGTTVTSYRSGTLQGITLDGGDAGAIYLKAVPIATNPKNLFITNYQAAGDTPTPASNTIQFGLGVTGGTQYTPLVINQTSVVANGYIRATNLATEPEAGTRTEIGGARLVFEDANVTSGAIGRVWEFDNQAGTLRWFTPGAVKMSLSTGGVLNTAGNITENGVRVLTNVTVTNNASVAVSNGTAAITNSLTPTFSSILVNTNAGMTIGNQGSGGPYYLSFIHAGSGGANSSGLRFGGDAAGSNEYTLLTEAGTLNLRMVTTAGTFNVIAAAGATNLQTWQSSTATVASINASGSAVFNGVNSVTGDIRASNGSLQARSNIASSGYTLVREGTTSNTGYVEFFFGNNIRSGYIGFGSLSPTTTDTGSINYNALLHAFGGPITASGSLTVSGASTLATFTATSGSMSGNLQINGSKQVYYNGIGTATGVVGTDIRFDTITGGAGAGVGNIGQQTVDAYNIKDGAIIASKLSLPAIASTIASGAGNNTANSFFRFVYTGNSYIDPKTGQEQSGLTPVNGAVVITDPQAYQGYAIQIQSSIAVFQVGQSGPNLGSLPNGIYTITVFVRASANTSSNRAALFDVTTTSGTATVYDNAGANPASINANQMSTTGYVGYSFSITTAGATGINVRTKSSAFIDVFVSHITCLPAPAVINPQVTAIFSPNIIATSATISSVSATSLIAGSINSDDIYLGSSGHIYAGNKNGGRVELNAAGVQSYATVNLISVNSNFDANSTTAWGSIGTSAGATDTTKSTSGSYSYKLTSSGSGQFGPYISGLGNGLGGKIIPGNTYTFAIDVNPDIAMNFQPTIEWYNGNSGLISVSSGTVQACNPTAWTRVYVTAVAPPLTYFANLTAYTTGSITSGTFAWFDSAQMEAGSSYTQYTTNTASSVPNLMLRSGASGAVFTTWQELTGSTVTSLGAGEYRTLAGGSGSTLRGYVNLADLTTLTSYVASITVRNDQGSSQSVTLDWCDGGSVAYTIPAGATRRIYTNAFSRSYDSTYRFFDITTTASTNLIYSFPQVEQGSVATAYSTNATSTITNFSLNNNSILTLTNKSGGRIILDPTTGMNFYDSTSVAKLTLDMTTGSALFKGDLSVGSSPTWFRVDSTSGAHWAGTANFPVSAAASNFAVSGAGTLWAQNATITGTVTATAGYIGTATNGWTINSSTITSRSGVTMAIDATAGAIYAGSGSSYVGMTAGVGFNAGNAIFASAPFRVDTAGTLVATNATITGQINATSGYIGTASTGWLFDANGIYGGTAGAVNSIRLQNPAGGGPYIQVFGNATNTYALMDGRSGSAGLFSIYSGGAAVFNADKSGNVTLTGTLSASSVIAGAIGGQNLLLNSNFEDNTNPGTYHSAYNASTITYDTGTFFQGTQSMKVVTTAVTQGLIIYSPRTTGYLVPANTNVVTSVWIKGTAGQTVNIAARPTNVAGSYITEGAGLVNVTFTGNWQRIITLPWTYTADYIVGFQIVSTSGAQTFYVDAAQAEIAQYASAYSPNPKDYQPGTIAGNSIITNTLSAQAITTSTLNASTNVTVGSSVVLRGTGTSTIAGYNISATDIYSGATPLAQNSITINNVSGGYIQSTGSGTSKVVMDGTTGGANAFYAYDGTQNTFAITKAGNVSVIGTITTGALTVTGLAGNFNVGGSTGFYVDPSGNHWSGASSLATAQSTKFAVTAAGAISASSGTIAGWTLSTSLLTGPSNNVILNSNGTISVGSTNAIVSMQQGTGLWAGHASFASAPFRVDTAGYLTTSAGTFKGAVNASTLSGQYSSSQNLATKNPQANNSTTNWIEGSSAGPATITQVVGTGWGGNGNAVRYDYTATARTWSYVFNQTFTGGVSGIMKAGSTYTISFYARSISGDTAMNAPIVCDGALTNQCWSSAGAITLTGAWTRYTYTGVATQDSISTNGFYWPRTNISTAAIFEVTGLQIEAGTAASTFNDGQQRVQIDSTGFNAYNSAGTAVTSISATTGAFSTSSLAVNAQGGTNGFYVDTTGRHWTGTSTFPASAAAAKFAVSANGTLWASSGVIGGFSLTATDLYSGGSPLATNSITINSTSGGYVGAAGTGGTLVVMDGRSATSNAFYIQDTSSNVVFSVSKAGAVSATTLQISGTSTFAGTISATAGGTIGGFAFSSSGTTLSAGTGATQITLDTSQGMWLGATTLGAAPFSVTRAGALTATNATITGNLTGSIWRTSLNTGNLTSNGYGVYVDNTGFYGFGFGNVLDNSSFEAPDAADAYMPSGWYRAAWPSGPGTLTNAQVYIDNSIGCIGNTSVGIVTDGTTMPSIGHSRQIPVTAGDVWHISAMVKGNVARAGGIYLRMVNQAGTEFTGSAATENKPITTSWVRIEGDITIPAGTTTVRPFMILHGPTTGGAATVNLDYFIAYKVTGAIAKLQTYIDTISGALNATNATMSGTIYASAGTVGGFNIGLTSIAAGTGSTSLLLSTGATALSIGNGNFVVSQTGNTTMTGTLNVTGNSTLGGTISVTGSATFSNTMSVTGSATFSSTLTTSGNTTLGGTLNVSGSATLNGSLTLGTGQIISTNFNVSSSGVVTATGATVTGVFNTAASGKRTELASNHYVSFYTGAGNEYAPPLISGDNPSGYTLLTLSSGALTGSTPRFSRIELFGSSLGSGNQAYIQVTPGGGGLQINGLVSSTLAMYASDFVATSTISGASMSVTGSVSGSSISSSGSISASGNITTNGGRQFPNGIAGYSSVAPAGGTANYTITHNIGHTNYSVMISPESPAAHMGFIITAKTSTNFTVSLKRLDGTSMINVTAGIGWAVIPY